MSSIEIYHAQAERLGRHLSKKYNLDLNQPQLLNAIAIAVLGERDWNHALAALKAAPPQPETASGKQAYPKPTDDFCYFVPEKPEPDGYYRIWRVFPDNPIRMGDVWEKMSADRNELLAVARQKNAEKGLSDAEVCAIVAAHKEVVRARDIEQLLRHGFLQLPEQAAKEKQVCYWVSGEPVPGGYLKGQFCVAHVRRGDAGFYPLVYHEDRSVLLEVCRRRNAEAGLSDTDVQAIVDSHIRALSALPLKNPAAPATEPKPKDLCYWVSDMPEEDGKFYVSIVKRDEPVYNELHGGYPDRQEAIKVAQLKNAELGLTDAEVKEIVDSSIRASIRQNGLR